MIEPSELERLPLITPELIEKSFNSGTIARGKQLYQQGKLIDIELLDKNEIMAVVKGKVEDFYRLSIKLPRKKTGTVQSSCDCYVGFECKHACAVIFALMAEQSKSVESHHTLSSSMKSWLSQLEEYQHQQQAERDKSDVLRYVVDVLKNFRGSYVQIKPQMARRLKKGGMSNPQSFYPNTLKQEEKISKNDREIFERLETFADTLFFNNTDFLLCDDNAKRIFNQILSTGRAVWQNYAGISLRPAAAITTTVSWQPMDNGIQKLTLAGSSKRPMFVLPLLQLWYLDPNSGETGLLNLEDIEPKLATTLWNTPAIRPDETAIVHAKLVELMGSTHNIPMPNIYKIEKHNPVKPQPILELHSELIVHNQYGQDSHEELYLARCKFNYGSADATIMSSDRSEHVHQLKNNVLLQTPRDKKAEQKYLRQLTKLELLDIKTLGLLPRGSLHSIEHPKSEYFISNDHDSDHLINFSLYNVPTLEAAGWQIDFAENYPVKKVIDPDKWYMEYQDETHSNDWFELELGIIVDGQRISLLPHLISMIQTGTLTKTQLEQNDDTKTFITLSQGKTISIDNRRLQDILKTLFSVYDKYDHDDNSLKISKYQLALIAEMERALQQDRLRWYGDERMLATARKLNDFEKIEPVKITNTLKATLRKYQHEGVNWLQFLREYNFGGILADDMGLGKTIQTLSHLLIEKQKKRLSKPCLIIAPTSVIVNWRLEASKFAPSFKILVLHGSDRKKHFDEIKNYDIVLTTYPLLVRDQALLLAHEFYYLILDEAQYIKNHRAKMTLVAHQIKAEHRLCLTGTPLENNLGELWSLFHFLMPGLLGSMAQFKEKYRTPIEKHEADDIKEGLVRMIKPFIMRRKKDKVVKELPAKTEIIRTIELEGKQRDLYETIRLAMNKKVKQAIADKGVEGSQIILLDALLKLRQACCDPSLVKLDKAKNITQSAKLEALMEILTELIQEGRKILLFSQFTKMLSIIEENVKSQGINYVKLTGSTRDRQKPIEAFQQGKADVFLISLKAGGTGLNLTQADTVIHYDPWWNPAVEAQATDRAHRLGQDKPVFVYKLIAQNSIEEKILTMQERKKALSELIFSGSAKSTKLTREDFEWLLN